MGRGAMNTPCRITSEDRTDPHITGLGRMMDDGEIANQIDEMAIKQVLETIEHDDNLAVATSNFLKLIASHDWDCGCSERVRNVLMSNVESLGQIAFAALKNTIESN
jgi:hypothetical protein